MDAHKNLSLIKTKAVYRKLNTKEFCFLCLKTTKIKFEDNEEHSGLEFHHHAKINQPVSLLCVRRHLKLNLTEIFQNTSVEASKEIEVDLCNDCEKIIRKFSVLFQELEKVQMEMDYQLEKINLCISEGAQSPELVQEYSKRMTSDVETLSQLALVDKIRKEISQKCLKVRIGSHQTVEMPRVSIENVTPSTLVVEESDTGDPAGGPNDNFSTPTSPSSVTYQDDEPLVESEVKLELHQNGKSQLPPKTFLQDLSTGKFCCPSCDKTYESKRNAREHYESAHLNKKWKCAICNVILSKHYSNIAWHKKNCRERLQRQRERERSRQHFKFQCATCGKRFPAKFLLQAHHRVVHSNSQYPCGTCNKIFKCPKSLQGHMKNMHLAVDASCKYCNTNFKTCAIRNHHQTKCPQRSLLKTEAKSALQSLLRDETGSYHCPSCTKTYPRLYMVRLHYNSVHLKKKFKCDLCNLTVFSDPYSLAKHKKKCLDTLQQRQKDRELRNSFKFHCQTCDKKFRTQACLSTHTIAVHASTRRFRCDHCEKGFKTGRHLQDHMDSVHLKKTYPCKFCNKILKHNSHYKHEKNCGMKNTGVKLEVTGS